MLTRRQNAKGQNASRGWMHTSVQAILSNPILTGRTRFNACKMILNREKGKRIPKMRDASEHLERQDEDLRIISDEMFAEIQAKMEKRATGAARAPHGIQPLTGLVYCHCGAKCYNVKGQSKTAAYRFYICSRHMRFEDCEGSARIRDDAIYTIVQNRFANLFGNGEKIIARALEIADAATKDNRAAADRVKSQLADSERDEARLLDLLMDRDIAPAAKKSIGRKLAEIEDGRTLLMASMDGLREQATADTEGLAAAIRAAFDDARRSLASASTPEQFNRLVDDFVGPLEVQADGNVKQKCLPTGDEIVCKSHTTPPGS